MGAFHAPPPTAFARRACAAIACALTLTAPALGAQEAPACPAHRDIPRQLRVLSCKLAGGVAAGLARSETFRSLVARTAELQGIVVIVEGHYWNPDTGRVLDGVLEHRVTRAGDFRVLFLRVGAEPGDRAIVTIAHELRHAIEVLESKAETEADVDALYDRIGSPAGAWLSETTAATEAGRAVLRELLVTAGTAAVR